MLDNRKLLHKHCNSALPNINLHLCVLSSVSLNALKGACHVSSFSISERARRPLLPQCSAAMSYLSSSGIERLRGTKLSCLVARREEVHQSLIDLFRAVEELLWAR